MLDLSNNQIDAKACEHLAPALEKMTALKELIVIETGFDAESCKHLAPALKKMTVLEILCLCVCPIVIVGDFCFCGYLRSIFWFVAIY